MTGKLLFRALILCLALNTSLCLFAQNETENNNSFATSNLISGTSINGDVGTGADGDDYFRIVTSQSGKILIDIQFNNSINGSDLYLYAYNRNQTSIGTNSVVNPIVGSSSDSLVLYCRDADTIYFRLFANGPFTYTINVSVLSSGTNDNDPNNTFQEAPFVAYGTTKSGRIGHTGITTDLNDYYKLYLPDNGTFRLITSYSNTDATAGSDLYLSVYNRNKVSIGTKSLINRPVGINLIDTLTIYCREADSMYIRLNTGSGCFSYNFYYEVISSGTNDTEPNNVISDSKFAAIGTQTSGRIGHSGTTTDIYDYYKIYIPENGQFRLYTNYINTDNTSGSDLYINAYDRNKTSISSKSLINRAIGVNPRDTFIIHCREADTMYIRYYAGSGCFSYQFEYEVITTGSNDNEPNNSFSTATFSPVGSVASGRVGHTGTSTDLYDYYKIYIPENGQFKLYSTTINTDNTAGSDIYLTVYNKAQVSIGQLSLTNRPIAVNLLDTLTINCREADTMFVRVYGPSGCFSYQFKYDVTTFWINDNEPNNTLATAKLISTKDTLRGRIGHLGTINDDNDYFKFAAPSNARITYKIDLKNTSGSTGSDLYVYFTRPNGQVLHSRSFLNHPLHDTKDTIVINCIAGDTIGLRLSANGCFSYQISFKVLDIGPKADIQSTRVGNTFSFLGNVKNAESIVWDFDDGDTSSRLLPVHEFGIGYYEVTLKTRNTTCKLSYTDTLKISVDGIERYEPKVGGAADGYGQVIMRVFGGGLDTMAIVTLSNGSTTIHPIYKSSDGKGELTLKFNLKDVPVGFYDVNFQLSGGFTTVFTKGFEVIADKPGFEIVAEITGPSRIRTNAWTNFGLVVSNDRNRVAEGVIACIAVPDGIETNIRDIIYKRKGTLKIDAAAYAKYLSIPPDVFNQTYFEGSFNPNSDTFSVNFDDIYQHIDSVVGIHVDSLYDEPWSGTVYHLLIPFVNAKSNYTVNFKARGTSTGNRSMIAFVWPYNMRINPISGKTLDNIHDLGLQAAALAELSPNPALKAVGESAAYVDIGSQIAFTEFFDWYYGVNNADEAFYAQQAMAFGGEVAGGLSPYGKRYESGLSKISAAKNNIRNGTKHIKYTEDMIKGWKVSPEIANRLKDDLAKLQDFVNNQGQNLTDAQKQAAMDGLKQYLTKQGINFTEDQLENLIFPENPCTNEPRNPKPKQINTLNSLDPNAVYGPIGFNNSNYIKKGNSLDYLVTFENIDTADVPAAEVRVTLNLDPNLYDLNKTTLGDVTIAGQTYFVEPNRNSLFRDIDLRPRLNLIVRLNAMVDTVKGNLTWVFTSLDPLSMEPVSDPLIGFLPPNINKPEGEGSVSFFTQMKSNIKHLDTIGCFADIYFDFNDPIQTNHWKNIIDDVKPVTSLDQNVTLENNNVMVFKINASETESGLLGYKLFMKMDNGIWNTNPLPVEPGTELRIVGKPGTMYQFYIVGRDSAGNQEEKPQIAEISYHLTSINSLKHNSNPFILFPNPNTGPVQLISYENIDDAEIQVYNITGQLMFELKMDIQENEIINLNIQKLPPGVYNIRILNADGLVYVLKMIVMSDN